MRRLISAILAMAMTIGFICFETVSIGAETSFTTRTKPPENNNKYYIRSGFSYGGVAGVNKCIFGNNSEGRRPTNVSVLPNCVGYAWGRAYEILGTVPKLSTGDANVWYKYTKDGYKRGTTPKLGAIACSKNHVRVIEKVYANGNVDYSESHWGYNVSTKQYEDGGTVFSYRKNVKLANIYGYIYIGDFEVSAPPTAPTSVTLSATDITVGGKVKVNWSGASGTINSYVVSLINTQGNTVAKSVTLSGSATNTEFTIDTAGTYKASVRAVNSVGGSTKESATAVTAHAPLKVTYYDDDGVTIVDERTVNYNGTIDKAAVNKPSKEGYDFNGWDTLTNITSDMTQTASYSLKSFTVMFLDHRGNRIGNPQTVGYKQAAIPPEPQNIPNGYSFVKWDNPNYNEVVSDMTVRQVIAWENPDFLVATSIESLTRNEAGDGYNVTVKIKGHPTKNASGKIIASLKTGDAGLLSEKMVSASVENFTKSAQPGNPDDDLIENIFVPYRGIITKAEVEVVGVLTDANTGVSDKTGAPIAAKAVITIDLNDQWSDWQTQDPGTNHEFVEGPVTRWHEKTREVKTSTTASLTGYDLYDTVKDVSAWSAWSRTNPASAANREIESRWVAPKYKTQYNYWGYRATKNGGNLYHFCDYLGKSIHGVTFSRRETGWQDNTLAFTSRSAQYCSHCGKTSYGYYGNYYYWVDTRQVQTAGGYYEYRYQDTTTTYYFEKWSDWSDWNYNGSTPAETSFKKVQTEQIYRYKDNLSTQQFYHYKRYKYLNMGNGNYYYTYTPAIVTDTLGYPGEWEYYRVPDAELAVLTVDNGITVYKTDNGDQWYQADVNNLGEFTQYIINETREDVNGKEISISGALAYSANKSAVIMVYKNYNTDPTEDQLEYIDHITLGANGEYALTFRPKEDPSRETGDFVVVVGVEGAVAPVYVETIYAPLPVYEVLFIDDNGEEIAKQMVHKGQAAELPEAIAKEGYTFIGWDRAATNVQTDLTVKAMYEKNTYSVVFIDWDNEFFDTVTFEHGDALVYPQEIEPNDGRLFTGWSKTDSDETVTTVTQNMIVTAKYDLAKYTVTFFDSDGIILKTQEVTHGEAADLPTQAIKSTEFQTFAFLERRHGIYNRRLIRLSGHAVCGRRSRPGGFSERRNIF